MSAPAELLVYRGRPVPYVTKWSAEALPPAQLAFRIGGAPGREALAYVQPSPVDRDAARGVFWFRDGAARGSGEPLWSTVHTGRQRRCMTRLLCQVCAAPLPPEGVPWLLPRREWDEMAALLAGGDRSTGTPPCCRACWPVAAGLCPELRRNGYVTLSVERAVPDGVTGELYAVRGRPEPGWLRFGAPELKRFMAKQMTVALHGIREESGDE